MVILALLDGFTYRVELFGLLDGFRFRFVPGSDALADATAITLKKIKDKNVSFAIVVVFTLIVILRS